MIQRSSCWDAVRVALLHIIAGPPIGGVAALTVLLPFMAGDVLWTGWRSILPLAIIGSYAVGTIPAAVTGLWAAARLWRQEQYRSIEAAAVSCFSGAAFLMALPLVHGQFLRQNDLILLALGCFASVVSALACRRLLLSVPRGNRLFPLPNPGLRR